MVMTAAITRNKKSTIKTRIAGLTWLAPASVGTKVFHACASAAGKRATIQTVIIKEMPLPIPRSVI